MNAKNLTSRSFKSLLERAGPLVPYAYTTSGIPVRPSPNSGCSPKVVQELLEHANISIILDT
jgi:hypothetical protein